MSETHHANRHHPLPLGHPVCWRNHFHFLRYEKSEMTTTEPTEAAHLADLDNPLEFRYLGGRKYFARTQSMNDTQRKRFDKWQFEQFTRQREALNHKREIDLKLSALAKAESDGATVGTSKSLLAIHAMYGSFTVQGRLAEFHRMITSALDVAGVETPCSCGSYETPCEC